MSQHDPQPKSSDDAKAVQRMWRMAGTGGEFAAGIAGMALIGWLIDRWRQSSPTWLIVLTALGFAGGLWNLIRIARQDFRS